MAKAKRKAKPAKKCGHEVELDAAGLCAFCEVERVCREGIPGYNPWDQKEDAWFDHQAALDAINWFAEHLKHVEGAARGEPFILRAWQAAIVGNVFGWKRKDDKGRVVRRYRKVGIWVARGNGKTPLAAGIVLYAYFEDGEPGSQCYLAAGARDQAGFLFRNAKGFVEQDEHLMGRCRIYSGDQHRSIVLQPEDGSFCKVIPADADKQHGGIPHVIALDELHVQESRELLDVFETGMSKSVRAQPLLVMITTADYDHPSICNEVYDIASAVRDNGGRKDRKGFNPSFLPVIYDLPPETDITNESLWGRANPNLDVSVTRKSLREIVQKAIEIPASANEIKRLHFNIRTAQDVSLIAMDQWDACFDPTLRLEDFIGQPGFGGLDLSSMEDLTSFYLVFPEPDDVVAVFGWSWCPSAKVLQRARKRKAPYDVWAQAGHIIETPGDSIHYGMVREKIVEVDKRHPIQFLYVDPHNARETGTILREAHGFEGRLIEFSQTMTELSSPTKDLIFRVKNKKLRHSGNPVTRWAAGNLAGYYKGRIPQGETLANYLDKVPIMPSKQSSADKIDPIAAIINALAAKASNPMCGGSSVYEERGVLVF